MSSLPTEEVDGVTLTVTEVFDTNFNPISSSWNDGTNSSSIAEVVDDVTFDFNNNGSDTTETVIQETGSRTWTWEDGDTTVTETVQFTNYYSDDGNRTYLGGTEVQDGITTDYYGDNGTKTVASTSYSTSGAPTVTASNGGWEASWLRHYTVMVLTTRPIRGRVGMARTRPSVRSLTLVAQSLVIAIPT